MARFGYTRIFQEVPERQADLDLLAAAGCDIIRAEVGGSAARTPNRQPVLDSIVELIGPGDVLVVSKPASLCGVGSRLIAILDLILAQGGGFEFYEPRVSSRRKSGRLFLEALRISLSLSFKPPIAIEIEALLAEGCGPTKIATRLGISRQAVYRYIWKRGIHNKPRSERSSEDKREGSSERAFERSFSMRQ